MKYDVIIVGAGPSGYMCAYELANKRKDLKILLLDRGRNIYDRKCPVLEHKLDKCPINQKGYRECFSVSHALPSSCRVLCDFF